MSKLSFDINNSKEFRYSHINDFKNGEVDVLFTNGIFIFWLHTKGGKLTHVSPTTKDEIDTWFENSGSEMYNITINEHSKHLMDAMYLNKEHLPQLEKKIRSVLEIIKD